MRLSLWPGSQKTRWHLHQGNEYPSRTWPPRCWGRSALSMAWCRSAKPLKHLPLVRCACKILRFMLAIPQHQFKSSRVLASTWATRLRKLTRSSAVSQRGKLLNLDHQAADLWRNLCRIRDALDEVALTILKMKQEGKDNAEIQQYAADLIVKQLLPRPTKATAPRRPCRSL